MVAEVIINSTAKKLNRVFDYNIPTHLEDFITVGSRVLVPFGKSGRLEEAYVVKIKEKSEYEIKDIAKIKNELSEDQIELAKWMAKKYFSNVSDCIKLMLTPGTRTKNTEKRISDKKINKIYLLKSYEEIEFDIESKKIKSEKQKRILDFVYQNQGVTVPEIELMTDCSRAIVNTLIKNGYLTQREEKIERNPLINKNIEKSSKLQLTDEQETAVNKVSSAIISNNFEKFLLYGVTGSGKTEVYLQLIDEVINANKTAIVLVPEISLTPQMLDRFIARFGKEKIAVLHSKLSIGERHDEWERIRLGEVQIVIGARSAIFSPLKNLGIIIIDEEHDSSYKSESNPRYDAKEVAEKIAKYSNCPVVFGSATPDMTTYYKAQSGKIKLLELTKRANNSNLPKVQVIDLKQELANGNRSMLSFKLYEMIKKNLENKMQTILFLNRRGFSTFIMCRDCGFTAKCKNCDISLTYHRQDHKLKCHYCGYEENVLTICPECGSKKIRYFGTGTQKLEEEIHKIFPQAKTIRMDVDTVTKKNSHEDILNKFKNDNIDILIGTQMVVKGHHFPKVTLVGVIAADSSLNIDDYRASERTFQILTQVAGRAGRDKYEGNVIVQSYNPDNFSIQYAKEQNYEKFYETEIAIRKQLKYPPFCDIIVIGFSSANEESIKKVSDFIHKTLQEKIIRDDFKILRPMPSPIDKIQNKYRWRMILKGNMDDEINSIINETLKQVYDQNIKDIRISVDVNPNNMV